MRTSFCFLTVAAAAAILLSSQAAHAAGGTGTSVGVSVVCSCDDPAGQSYGKAVQDLISHDPHFHQVSEEDAQREDAIEIHIISQPLTSGKSEAISVVYTHDGAFLHQFIETTCAATPLNDSAVSVLRQIREMEQDVQAIASAPAPPRTHHL